MISEVKPTPVTVGGAQWPVLFTFRAWRALTRHYGSLQDALEAAGRLDQSMVATFFWAGLLHDNPDLTPEDATALLNEADFAELEAVPAALIEAIRSAQPERQSDGGGGDWDFDVAYAAWTKEWSQPRAEFDLITFRDFAQLSDGLAKLYDSAKKQGSDGAPAGDWSIGNLMAMNRGGRR